MRTARAAFVRLTRHAAVIGTTHPSRRRHQRTRAARASTQTETEKSSRGQKSGGPPGVLTRSRSPGGLRVLGEEAKILRLQHAAHGRGLPNGVAAWGAAGAGQRFGASLT